MMFKTTTVIALAAALVSNAQAAAVDGATSFKARQVTCPTSGQHCGWFLLNNGCVANRGVLDAIPHGGADVFRSIWSLEDSQPVTWVQDCVSGCSEIGDRPQTECN
ncbi:hypothetical protein F5144DRAFT_486112 [Chaetomium tenue]|uniref:Uncharacterized protein n=1 Tax=Chaetomium tenue TaxID=1854479 RepID=A0ACB7PG10_9PEZI|nr:hypothetical protein F5144DRAFT_486112 [Chaetomium globosum]